jgi:glycosyltransferase involved in cell wall biosynthesis
MTDITAVLNAHAEGILIGPSLNSFMRAIDTARAANLEVEGIIVLDRPDAATRAQATSMAPVLRIIESNFGDPGQARNAGAQEARGEYVAYLDGDDLWSSNWLRDSYEFCTKQTTPVVVHSQIDIIFGAQRLLWMHADSRAKNFNADFLRFSNYWNAMSFSSRDILLRFPFAKTDFKRGFGHEDWHWNCLTYAAGIHHCPVPGTVHFKRRRAGTQFAQAVSVNALPWVTPLAAYDWAPNQG